MLNQLRHLACLWGQLWYASGGQGACGVPPLASVASEPHDSLSPRLTGLTGTQVALATFAHGTLECLSPAHEMQSRSCPTNRLHNHWGFVGQEEGDSGGTKKGQVSLYFYSASMY